MVEFHCSSNPALESSMVRHLRWSKTLAADIPPPGNIIVQYKHTKQKQSEMSFQR